MGPLEGVQDVLGVSQSTATTRAKDQGAVISCLKNIYPCTGEIKKKKFPGLFMDNKKKKI